MTEQVPPWLASLRADLGVEEIPGPAVNPRIIAKARLPGVKFPTVDGLVDYGKEYTSDDTQAWCGAEWGGSLAEVGIMPPFNKADNYKSYFWADSCLTWGVPCDMRVGATCGYGGHVNLVDEIIDADTFWGIGGNQGSPNGGAVTRSKRSRASVKAFRWPDDASLQQAGLIQFSLSAKPGAATTTTVRPLIKFGATGGFVTELQKILAIPASGIFDAATDAAVRAFQGQHGLDPDGEVGPLSWGALLGTSITIAGDIPHAAEYADQWSRMVIAPAHDGEVTAIAHKLIGNKARYQAAVAGTNVPWSFVAVIHQRESGADFSRNIHNGQPLGQVTTDEPTGRGPFASWEASVQDWIKLKALDHVAAWPVEGFAYHSESNNGMGYRNKGVPSAYLWSFSNIYQGGKYVADHVWSATAVDAQCGTMPMLKRMMELDTSIVLTTPPPTPLDGDVLDPLKPGDPAPDPALKNILLVGAGLAGLVVVMRSMEKSPMANAPAGQGIDLNKLLAGIPKILALLQNPVVKKAFSGQQLSLDEIVSLLQIAGPLIGDLLAPSVPALAPPVVAEPAPVDTAAPAAAAPAPTTPPAPTSKVTTNAVGGLLGVLAGLGLGAGGVIGAPIGPDATLVGELWPLVSIGLAAIGVPAPIVSAGSAVLSALAGAFTTKQPKA